MNLTLNILQVLLAIHTAIGAIWKFKNAETVVPVLRIIPVEWWYIISTIELVAAALLILPMVTTLRKRLASIGSLIVMIEMATFSLILLFSGSANYEPVYYWLVVLAIAGFVTYKRFCWHMLRA